MLSLLSKLQRKPEQTRKRIAIVASAAVTGVIIIFWLVSIGSSLADPAPKAVSSEQKEVGPFHALIEGFGGIFSGMAPTPQTAASATESPKGADSIAPTEEPSAPVSD